MLNALVLIHRKQCLVSVATHSNRMKHFETASPLALKPSHRTVYMWRPQTSLTFMPSKFQTWEPTTPSRICFKQVPTSCCSNDFQNGGMAKRRDVTALVVQPKVNPRPPKCSRLIVSVRQPFPAWLKTKTKHTRALLSGGEYKLTWDAIGN